jgi:hypothetical protein
MAAEVGLLAHSEDGVARKLRDKMDIGAKPIRFGLARLSLGPFAPVEASQYRFDFPLPTVALEIAP